MLDDRGGWEKVLGVFVIRGRVSERVSADVEGRQGT